MKRKRDERELREGSNGDAPFWTCREMARMHHVTLDTLRVWRRQGVGPPFLAPTRSAVVYPKAAYAKWEKKNTRTKQLPEEHPKRKHKPKPESADAPP